MKEKEKEEIKNKLEEKENNNSTSPLRGQSVSQSINRFFLSVTPVDD